MDWWDWQGIGASGFWGDAAGWVENLICRKCAGMVELRCVVAGVLFFDFMNPCILLRKVVTLPCYCWLKSGNEFKFIGGIYQFSVSPSHYLQLQKQHSWNMWLEGGFTYSTWRLRIFFSGWEEVQPLPASWLQILQSDFRINESINDQWRITEEPQVESNYQAKNSRWCFKVSGW